MTDKIVFRSSDVARFARASHDRNPLHVSARYARATPYGQPVVYGCLGALAALGRVQSEPGRVIERIDFEFTRPIFTDVEYSTVVSATAERTQVRIVDGRTIVSKVIFVHADGEPLPVAIDPEPVGVREEAAELSRQQIQPGLIVTGQWAPDRAAFTELLTEIGVPGDATHQHSAAALLLASYIVGMELPGVRAMFWRGSLTLATGVRWSGPVEYRVTVQEVDDRYDVATNQVEVRTGGTVVVEGTLDSFIRPDSPVSSRAAVEALLASSSRLSGKTAVVIGASRGLGASITTALVLQGCTVFGTYRSSKDEAERLCAELTDAPGRLIMAAGDAADPAWCNNLLTQVVEQGRKIDYVICNAAPPPLSFVIDAATVGRINLAISNGLALSSVPLAVFVDALNRNGGCAVLISSAAVEEPPVEWPQYVAMKAAAEALFRVASLQNRKASFLIMRPGKLLTDMSNTSVRRQGARPPEQAAVQLVERLLAGAAPGQVEIVR